jgi:L-lactate utilization protein LutC
MTNFSNLANQSSLEKTRTSLIQKGYDVAVFSQKADALEKIKTLIPSGASVMNGSSTTLAQIGYLKYLKEGKHSWVDLHAKITAENEEAKRQQLRKESVLSDYYLGSVHALSESGEMIIASNTGSQLPHLVFTSPNIILVISTKKIVPDVNTALQRVEEYVVPLEEKRMQEAMNAHTALNKILIFKNEAAFMGRKIHILLVEEDLGF